MKKLLFLIIVLLIGGYLIKSYFGSLVPDTTQIQGSLLEIKDEIEQSAKNLTDEFNRVKDEFQTKKEAVEEKVEQVENLVDAVNDLTE
ncbi:MAG: hypothetical protein ABH856_04945 [Patescibacteria group bacterium]|nr:hypothetical protein [Patescibacteria group bacterium]